MMKNYLSILALFLSLTVFGQNDAYYSLDKYLQEKGEAFVKINTNSSKDIINLAPLMSIDEVDGDAVYAYMYEKGFAGFQELGLSFEILQKPGELFIPKMYDGINKEAYEWDAYPTYEAYVEMMYEFATNYPDICEVFSIGTSEEGREILFAKISDNVSTSEPEGQFMYTGTIHGDETAGFVLFLRLIDYLTSNYGTDAEVTELVNNLEIWVNPAANPDGTYYGGNNSVFGARRANANNVDLNRNYHDPNPAYGEHPDGNEYQAETEAFMALADEQNFVMAATTHGGAEVLNYPWDTWNLHTADDAWWVFVCREYADTCHAFAPSNYMNQFDNGITHGYSWYPTHGSRQDYMNYFHHCREVTLEISDTKLIPESQLENHWVYNKRSMINYMKQMYYGVQGIITDSITEEPLVAKVEILDHDELNSFVYSRDGLGNYHRLVKAGTYDFKFSAEGYLPKTFIGVEAEDYESTILNVQLVSATLTADFSADQVLVAAGSTVQFSEDCWGEPDTYSWTFEGGTPATSTEANPQVIYNEVGIFDVSLVITKGSDIQSISKEEYISVNEEYIIEDGGVTTCSGLFLDNGGLDANYSANLDYIYTIYGSEDAETAILSVDFTSFAVEYHASCNYDYLEIYDGPNTTSEFIGKYCGTDNPGTVISTHPENALTFVFHSDGSQEDAGWTAAISCTIIDQISLVDAQDALKIYPNPVNNGWLHIELNQGINEINMYNLSGQEIKTWNTSGTKQNINISAIEAGVYLLTVKSNDAVYHQKVKVQ
ncbi:T9SS type A sorting domain-containing protein [Lentimicrobium sp. L6]|uniref:M14 family zinc carboxypeptidase n=1 Tax=Lentimicrobium sp. L6 TaxID=2735916 RepID=UPI0015525DCC|nr:M14 family zinc carboxypeptidase [Lentimicrobium sp. L6]NPD83760.1 T9SS type A sorting domain-containing protein [Lentimicrobium sp. L6]